MRIISGKLGGRVIKAPDDGGTRPAMARTRESLFSMLEARGIDWPQTPSLDLFAGSGSLAFEAISRGAPHATLVDNGARQCAALARAAASLDIAQNVTIVRQDVGRFLRSPAGHAFGLVFVDPPYRRDFASPALNALAANGWLMQEAFVAAELESGIRLKLPPGLEPIAQRPFGQTLLIIWKWHENSPLPRHL